MKIYDDITELIGKTPVVRVHRYQKARGLEGELLVKIESFNPNGSAKDRIGVAMLDGAEKDGSLARGGTVIEPTSGNTGIGLAMACAVRGYRLILTMPESMSVERRKILAALGAELVLTPAKESMNGAVNKANALHAEIPGSIIAGQFVNPANPAVHRATTAKEIMSDLDGKLDYFVAGVGTGGTISGVGEALKPIIPDLKVVAVEPADSPLLSKGVAGSHKLQGIGANFVPAVLDRAIIDDVIAVTTDEAYSSARLLGKTEGFTCGVSGGAALYAGEKILRAHPGARVLVFLPDGGDRYLSTDLYEG